MRKRGKKSFINPILSKARKAGLSTIVITLIIILISLVAVGIIWVVVRNVIQKGADQLALGQFTLDAKITDVTTQNASNNVTLTVRRNAGEGAFTKINFVFSDGKQSEVLTELVSLKELEERRFILHLSLLNVSKLISISIVPILNQDGNEILGNVLDKYTVGKGSEQSGTQTPPVADTTAPVLSNPMPTGTLPAGTTSIAFNVTTDENAICRYSLTSGVTYDSMTKTFSQTGGTMHVNLTTGLTNGNYNYYVKCKDSSGNNNTADFPISFSVAAPPSGPICEATGGRKCWYVDNLATGNNNGSSWTNAWTTFSSINWASIKPGDFVYISGGAASKTYTESWTVGANGNSTSQITIKSGQDTGHNGIVIFDYNSDGDASTRVAITLTYRNYITFNGNVNGESHLQINNLRNINDAGMTAGIGGYDHIGIIIDYLTFINDNNPIRLSYCTNITIRNSIFQKVRGDAAIRLIMSSESWDVNKVYNNYIETAFNNSMPSGATYSYGGPDGIQSTSGLSAYNNTFKVVRVPFYTSSQHPDMFQITGNYMKIYNNEFINIGDSAIDFDCFSSPNPHDVWIYNNIFHIVDAIDNYPEYFRLYSTNLAIQSLSNFKILNNVFVDNTDWTSVSFSGYRGNPTGSGNEIKNNIFYNNGRGDSYFPNIKLDDSSNFNSASFSFDGNIYYHPSNIPHIVFRGIDYSATAWISANEPLGKVAAPVFVSYAPFSASNNFHLSPSDTAAKNAGLSLSSYFTTDKDGISRPQGSAWDIGAYES